MERRRFSRIPVANQAALTAGEERIEGQVTDLSLNGLRLLTAQRLPERTPVTITLQLGEDGSDWVLEIPGRVQHQHRGALGVQFDLVSIEDRTLVILERILALAHGDDSLVKREYQNYMAALIRKKKKLRKLARKRARREGGEPD